MKLDNLAHIILSATSLGVECRGLLLKNTTYLYWCLLQECLILREAIALYNCLVCIQISQLTIFLYLGLIVFNYTGNEYLKIVSLTNKIIILTHKRKTTM